MSGSNGAGTQGPGRRQSLTPKRAGGPSLIRKKTPTENGSGAFRKLNTARSGTGERTVNRLKLSKALTIPEGTTVAEASRRMAQRRVDAALLTDSNALLSGIMTDKDVATRVIAEGLKPEETVVSKVMTRNPIFVMADSMAVEALQKMVQGKFRHLPVVENGQVIALLDITKCLYDAISRMERAAEKGNAIADAVEGVEREWSSTLSAPSGFIETLRERMFRPTLGSLFTETTKVATVLPSDSIYLATKKMRELRVSSVIVTTGNKPQGILTSKDVLLRVVAAGLNPEQPVEKVMTPNPECASVETTIVDALHTMHDGKFLHLPVVNRDGHVVACVDVLQLTHGAVATVGTNVGGSGDLGGSMVQKFWDTAFALDPPEDDDTQSEASIKLGQDALGSDKMGNSLSKSGNLFSFKLEDRRGRIHRFQCGTDRLSDLLSAVRQRIGDDVCHFPLLNIMYEDDEGDRVLLESDSDLLAAVSFAKSSGSKGLRLFFENSPTKTSKTETMHFDSSNTSSRSAYTAAVAGAAVVIGISVMFYLRRSHMYSST
ncbi:hypothetical protein O6H91_18G060400 [Diphasiastrum complanatum]|uniref:Uncharacterized protein n=1 Tax=Diphasiastrum complanatum TaxID=34168 RepID=A0ACC2B1X9_DIPCM|nr:hypothetical protein O6H91_18G060400 [Diphasiastrum complanatum]